MPSKPFAILTRMRNAAFFASCHTRYRLGRCPQVVEGTLGQARTRSLDILQVATAIMLRADTLLTFDRNQVALARAEGLQTPISI